MPTYATERSAGNCSGVADLGLILLCVVVRCLTICAVDVIEVAGVCQHLDHVAGPSLPLLLQEVGQLAQVVGVAQGVLARQCFVGYPAVMHQDTLELLEQGQRFKSLGASLVHGLCQAFMKRGLPRALMTDNGAAMLCDETVTGLARLGVVHQTTLPYSPYQYVT